MSKHVACAVLFTLAHLSVTPVAKAQESQHLSLSDARSRARAASAELAAAREAVAVARGLERQARAFTNPTFGFSAERTSRGAQTNRQRITELDQPVELGGQRRARREIGALRVRSAEARLANAEALVDFEVSRRYAAALGADRRASLARNASQAFAEAARVSERRVAAGDISVYADRRLRLEAARYSALEAEAIMVRQAARFALSALISPAIDPIRATNVVLTDSLPAVPGALTADSLLQAAFSRRADLQAIGLEADASMAEARLASRERIPTPVLSAGFKTEESAGSPESLRGFVAGFSLPLPVWDRRRGAVQAAEATARLRVSEREAARRRVAMEVAELHATLVAAEQQIALLAPQLGTRSAAALRSAQVAYAEGEITLIEWLDAVRAYHEAETAYANLVAETMIRRGALERAVGIPLENVR